MLNHTIQFNNQHQARLIHAARYEDLPQALRSLGLEESRPAIVAITGAGGVAPQHLLALQNVAEVIARLAERSGAAVIDGGTQSGGMEAMGLACLRHGYRFPLVGVAAQGTVALPSTPGDEHQADLDPNHTHFVLAPGDEWGAETPWISRVAAQIAGPLPSLTVLANGGSIARQDIAASLQAERPVFVLQGTGRLADELAAHPPSTPLITILSLEDGMGLEKVLWAVLSQLP